jgi:GNAT superfamily N-acetyltransferase
MAFLQARIETSMFPLSNVAAHGMSGGPPRAMRFWGQGEPLEAVLGVAEEGLVLPQVPLGLALPAARVMAGLRVIGLVGEGEQVDALVEAAGLGQAETELHERETLFSLDLAHLRMPDTGGLSLVPLDAVPRDLVIRWRADYGREVLGWREDALTRAEADVDSYTAAGQHRVLLRGQEPVATTGFNARLQDAVQVGGVWTPPTLRGQGLARAAVGLHLLEARASGATRAVLFAVSEPAKRVYRSLGFGDIGRFTLPIFRQPQEVRPA